MSAPGRKPLLLAGFAIEAVRVLLLAFISDPWLIMAVQVLDGLTGAIITVLMILVITDLTTGTGRFNLAQGALGTATAAAAAISTAASGVVVQHFGDFVGFMSMAIAMLAGTALLWAFVPETKPAKYVD